MLMPSLFEPCGLTQLISLRYGTVPIVRETGGLKDTVQPYNEFEQTGIGFSFANYNADELLDKIRPRYVVVKPTLHGGLSGAKEWIDKARERGIGSWVTSALESNAGLNAIAHFAAEVYGPDFAMPQGLGTGQLFTENIDMPIRIDGQRLFVCTKE